MALLNPPAANRASEMRSRVFLRRTKYDKFDSNVSDYRHFSSFMNYTRYCNISSASFHDDTS